MEIATTQKKIEPLTYEQEVHALLCSAASNTESLLQYFEAQAATEKGDARKLTQKCIEWKQDDLRRIRELIPQALERRENHSQKGRAGTNYVADDSVYPTRIEFFNGRVVAIKEEDGRVFLGVGMKEQI